LDSVSSSLAIFFWGNDLDPCEGNSDFFSGFDCDSHSCSDCCSFFAENDWPSWDLQETSFVAEIDSFFWEIEKSLRIARRSERKIWNEKEKESENWSQRIEKISFVKERNVSSEMRLTRLRTSFRGCSIQLRQSSLSLLLSLRNS